MEGNVISGKVLTTELAEKGAPGLLRNAIDKAIVKIRPMATPLDQISRMGHRRAVDSMEVEYYSVDSRGDRTMVTGVDSSTEEDVWLFMVDDADIFEASESFAYRTADGGFGTAYVIGKSGEILEVSLMGESIDNIDLSAPIIRMGRAATQLDVQSPQFSILPKKRSNLCQIFKMQIEQSVVMKLSHKEIGWNLSDQQEAAIYDMRMGMEKQYLFGRKGKVYDPKKGETVTLTEGIWHQAGKELNVDLKSFGGSELVDLLRGAFTENSGSRRKVLMAGSELISALNKIESVHVLTARDQVTAWGIDFSVLQSKFGKLYVVFSDIFDVMGMPGCGLIVDPEYIQKHVFIPFQAEKLDLRGSGQRNTEALVLTEAGCLTLRYPGAHARVIGA